MTPFEQVPKAGGSNSFCGKEECYSQKKLSLKRIEFPKEIRIVGKISHVEIEGNDYSLNAVDDHLLTKNAIQRIDVKCKEKKSFAIVPIQSRNSDVHFVKVPIFRLVGKPNATKIGEIRCRKVSTSGESLSKWSVDRQEFSEWKPRGAKLKTHQTCIIFRANSPHRRQFGTQTKLENHSDSSLKNKCRSRRKFESEKNLEEPKFEEEITRCWSRMSFSNAVTTQLNENFRNPITTSGPEHSGGSKKRDITSKTTPSSSSRALSFLVTVPK